jgi:hypothetical protein
MKTMIFLNTVKIKKGVEISKLSNDTKKIISNSFTWNEKLNIFSTITVIIINMF